MSRFLTITLIVVIAVTAVVMLRDRSTAAETDRPELAVEIAKEAKTPAEPVTQTVTLAAVGDIMTSRVVGQKMVANGFDYPFAKTTELLANQDIVFANLETPLIEGPPVNTGTMVFRSDPAAATALKDAGFDVVSLANNHTMNKGSAGLRRTFEILTEAGIAWVGAGQNLAEARAPLIIERQGLKIAWLAATDTDVIPTTYAATADKPGNNVMNIEQLTADVAQARAQADFVLVSMHSGTEYVVEPNARQTEFAHAAIDAGADAVIAQHPHVVQRAEVYHDRLIFYSLGNFVFDQMWSQDTREGLVIFLTLTKTTPSGGSSESKITVNDLVPVQIDDYAQPHVIKAGPQKERVLNRLGDYHSLID